MFACPDWGPSEHPCRFSNVLIPQTLISCSPHFFTVPVFSQTAAPHAAAANPDAKNSHLEKRSCTQVTPLAPACTEKKPPGDFRGLGAVCNQGILLVHGCSRCCRCRRCRGRHRAGRCGGHRRLLSRLRCFLLLTTCEREQCGDYECRHNSRYLLHTLSPPFFSSFLPQRACRNKNMNLIKSTLQPGESG